MNNEKMLEDEIRGYIGGLEYDSLQFDFNTQDGKIKLDVTTINPIHKQHFLFHTVLGYDREDALKKMLDYVKNYKERESSYTVQWSQRGENELHTSYFRAKNVLDALDKLTFGRDMNSMIVYSIVLNPIS